MRRILIIGNWKLNGNKKTIVHLLTVLSKQLINIDKCDIIIAPPLLYLDTAQKILINSNIQLCAQNVDIHTSGAFTGEISAEMLKDLRIRYVLIGHSERRINHKESDLYIAEKFFISKKTGLIPILCIGENKIEYESGHTKSVCLEQIEVILKMLGIQAFKNSIIAYEPIWAIGSGLSASPKFIQDIHQFIRNHIAKYDISIADTISIQYGGSVNPNNVIQLISQKDIDGVLVGSSSLNAHSFYIIIKSIIQHITLIQNI